jgi:hypothetical protein
MSAAGPATRLGVLADARGLWLERATSLPRPGIIQPALTAAVIATWVDEGWQAYLDGKFQVSALPLESALYAARENLALGLPSTPVDRHQVTLGDGQQALC